MALDRGGLQGAVLVGGATNELEIAELVTFAQKRQTPIDVLNKGQFLRILPSDSNNDNRLPFDENRQAITSFSFPTSRTNLAAKGPDFFRKKLRFDAHARTSTLTNRKQVDLSIRLIASDRFRG